ncbi:MAG: hypothetical protein FWF92_02295 [Oscillospiraceae bacterium]|nr:hypothetical protein [Oscillospiraceae bacterium]
MILRNFKKLFILISVILIALILFSCGDNALKFKNDGNTGNLIDGENGRYYIYCKGYLQAAAISPYIYAKGDQGEKLYEVDGIDPSKWLSEDINNGIAFLFREQSEEEPEFETFETERIHIVMSEEVSVAVGLIDDMKDVYTIVNDYIYNPETDYPGFVTDRFDFCFESEKYSGIYYVLQYLVDERNNAYLYNRWTGRCVSCGVKLFGGSGVGADID